MKPNREFVPPVTAIEKTICRGFETVLHADTVGAEDDFFLLGGKMEAAAAVAEACARYGVAPEDILEGKTPRAIAKLTEAKKESLFAALPRGKEKALLTVSQMGIYLSCMLQPESRMYNIVFHTTIKMQKIPSIGDVSHAINRVLEMHPALYAQIEEENDQVYMVRCAYPSEGLCRVHEEVFTSDAVNSLLEGFSQTINLKTGPLCRAEACVCNGEIHVIIETHHIVMDGTSANILARQFCQSLSGQEIEAERIDPFSLYEVEERQRAGEEYQAAEAYYEGLLGGVECDSNLLPDFKSEESGLHNARQIDFPFEVQAVEDGLSQTGISKNTLFMAAFGYTLAKMTGQADSLFTSGESGRPAGFLDNTVSMMVKTIPVVLHFDEDKNGMEILRELQRQFSESIRHDCFPFREMNRKYGISSDISFVYQSSLFSAQCCDISVEIEKHPTRDAQANLNTSVLKQKDRFIFRVEYRKDLYQESTIRRFGDLFIRAVSHLLSGKPMKEMRLVSEEDIRLLTSFKGRELAYQTNKTFVDIFAETAKKYCHKTAVVYADKKYTYGEVDEITDRIATYVHSRGIGREEAVAVLIPRSEYIALASLGVIKAGAVYVPLDPDYPPERLALMVEDASARLLIADRSLMHLLPGYNGPVLYIDEIANLPPVSPRELETCAPKSGDTFVLLYTSGTSGKPKGCMLSHGNLAAFIAAHTQNVSMDEQCKVTLYAGYGFDAHMSDLYPALANGCELHIIPQQLRLDFPLLKEYLEKNGITHLFMTTQVARQFILEYPSVKSLRVVFTGGESLLSYQAGTSYRVFNMYGPTETTCYVTCFPIDCHCDPIPIGHTSPNIRLYVVDSYGRNVPVGAPGELIIAGRQVSKGYLNRPEKTAEVFVKNTYQEEPESAYMNCYKTGDIVRYRDDGNLLFIGRRDMQVKIRGFRIELSEVEQVLRSYPDIKDAVVVAADHNGNKCLNAYIVSDREIRIEDLKRYIHSQKPAYMVPEGILQIDAIPLTVNQKVNRRALPPIPKAAKGEESTRSLTAIEKSLMDILREIVGDGEIGLQTTFSDAGITSITSIKLAGRIYKKYGLHITSAELLNGGTILSVENQIIAYLLENRAEQANTSPKPLLPRYPLTQAQLSIYLSCQSAGISAYNVPLMFKLPENISVAGLKHAIRIAVQNHPSILMYIYADEKGNIAAYPVPNMEFEIEETALEELPPAPTQFEFAPKPLFHFSIITCKGERYLLMEIHHIICDGESMAVLMDDIDRAYRGEALLPEEVTAYDLSLREQSARDGSELIKAKASYDAIFSDISSDYKPCRDRREEDAYALLHYPISANYKTIQALCSAYKITPNTFFTAVFALTLAKYTAQNEALFATIHNGRTDPKTERLVGMLVKTLPVFIRSAPEASPEDFLRQVQEQLNILRLNDIFSFADAAKSYGIAADVMFIYQGEIMTGIHFAGSIIQPIPLSFEKPKVDLCVQIFTRDQAFALAIEYNSGHYSSAWTESFADAFATCAESLLKVSKLAEIDILSEKAFHRFDCFNDTAIEVAYRPAYSRLTEQALKDPNKIAIISSPEDAAAFKNEAGQRCYEKLTFGQLNYISNELAHRLIALGIVPGTPIGVMTGRTKEIYIGEFGILKAGCPFVFLSPAYPAERIGFICKDASIGAIVTTSAISATHAEMFEGLNIPVILADDIPKDAKASCPNLAIEPSSPAYMIYTSGSTGRPKGVIITQANINNLTDNNVKNLQTRGLLAPIMCAVTSFSFDASILDGYVSLSNGCTVCIASEEDIHNPMEFCRLCLDNGVMSYVCTPSFADSLLDCKDYELVAKQLQAICCGGEVYPPALYNKLKAINPDIKLLNGYGPSEATVACSAKLLSSPENITVGRPISNCKIYIIDRQNHILPKGALGELVITGAGVGKGYLNRDDLTQKSYFTLNGEPAYKSGDLALIDHEDEIIFHGRIDNQVKLRGLRVELGEIESGINSCEGINNCAVVVKGENNNRYLAAYYTADIPLSPDEIKGKIAQTLPEYMVPKVLMQLDEMPVTANGKIDRRALPDIEIAPEKREYIGPSNRIEAILCRAFAQALGLEKVGVTENFFELGGTSLTATKVAMAAMANNIPIAYKDIFANPTVRQLGLLESIVGQITNESDIAKADYTLANHSLAGNTWDLDDETGTRPLGNVLLTGATGFLGIHVLKNLLDNESGEIYCLLQKGSFTSVELKLKGLFFYYFDQTPDEYLGKRLHCIEGDITDRNGVMSLRSLKFDTVINCAACVKHFVKDDILDKVNVEGVENLIDLCLEKKSRLIHVSTVSIAGESLNGIPTPDNKLTENRLYFGQLLDNQYILSKFRAEKRVLDAIANGLDAKIMRAGNLMPRFIDETFQINFASNGFMRRLLGYCALGCVPYSTLSVELEFSPIDDAAEIMLALAKTDKRLTVFHTYNVHKVYMSDVIRAMNKAGIPIKSVSEQTFLEKLKAATQNPDANNNVGGLIAYLNGSNHEDRQMIGWDNTFTVRVMNRLGCNWNIVDDDYLVNVFKYLNDLGFFTIHAAVNNASKE